jgi:hypothetical protein
MPPVRVDEHTPASFAVLLARHFGYAGVQEPADVKEAQALITAGAPACLNIFSIFSQYFPYVLLKSFRFHI